jgi:4-hydroxybenzoate polyprenyltransferase
MMDSTVRDQQPENAASHRVSLATKIRQMLEMIRFSHSIFALPFACLAGLWAIAVDDDGANPARSWLRWAGILVCMITARSFAMAWNRLVDSDIDARNPRTAKRHLPAGILSRYEVQIFALACALLFVASCLIFLPNRLPLYLSVPVLMFLAGYSHAKRFMNWVHAWLGVALMLAPICTWIALRGEAITMSMADLLPAVWLGLGVLFWVTGFDIIYACQDADFDREEGLFSIPAKLGVKNALRVAAVSHAVMVAVLVSLGFLFPQLSLGWVWYSALGLIAVVLLVEHSMVSEKDLTKVNIAFFNMNAVISLVLLVAGTIDGFWR